MPSKFRVRHIFRPLVDLIAKGLSKIGIQNPNVATIIMLSCAIISSFLLVFLQNLILFALFVFLTGIFDGVDGSLSKINNLSTEKGGFLDSTMDRFSEFIIILGIIIYSWNQVLWDFIDMKLIIFIALLATLLISYSRARAENFFKGDFDIGLMARSERLFYLVITSIFAFFYGFFNEFLFLYTCLVIATVIFRFFKFKKQIKAYEAGI